MEPDWEILVGTLGRSSPHTTPREGGDRAERNEERDGGRERVRERERERERERKVERKISDKRKNSNTEMFNISESSRNASFLRSRKCIFLLKFLYFSVKMVLCAKLWFFVDRGRENSRF